MPELATQRCVWVSAPAEWCDACKFMSLLAGEDPAAVALIPPETTLGEIRAIFPCERVAGPGVAAVIDWEAIGWGGI